VPLEVLQPLGYNPFGNNESIPDRYLSQFVFSGDNLDICVYLINFSFTLLHARAHQGMMSRQGWAQDLKNRYVEKLDKIYNKF